MMKKIACVLLACLTGTICLAKEEEVEQGIQKVMLKISTVETVGTRTQKTWNPPAMPMALQEMPFSEQDIAKATPEEAQRMSRANHARRLDNQRAQSAIALRAFEESSRHYRGVKKQLEGTTFGRQVILAVDKFVGAAGEYFDPECIEFFHRMDMDEGDKESFMKDMKTADLVTAPYFLKLIFDDPRIETGKINMNGQEVKMTKMIQTITYSVQSLAGKVITSGNVKKTKTKRSTNAVASEGADENMLIDVMEEALIEVAKRINSFFVATATITIKGPKKDTDFDAEGATIQIDGTDYQPGEEFTIMKGKHTIIVELDGYKPRKMSRSFRKTNKITIKLKKDPKAKADDDDEDEE